MIMCIYCGELKLRTEFNREHVMPESFGTFEHNFVLSELVCASCNCYFGGSLDLVLGRETMEGLQCFESGLREPSSKHRFGAGRLKTTLRGTAYDGARLEWRAADNGTPGMAVNPMPQVGIGSEPTGPFEWYSLRDIPSRDELRGRGFSGPIHMRIWGCEDSEARQALIDRGFTGDFVFEPASSEVLAPEVFRTQVHASAA